jgi:hypothetical protein
MAIAAFLSHSSKDRRLAGALKDGLAEFGVDVFVAHADLQPSEDWQKEILRQLRHSDVFVCLLTDNFPLSLWTDQETGLAIAHRKLILPLKKDMDPYGFISKYQALTVDKRIADTCWEIAQILADRSEFAETIKDSVIDQFLDSAEFEESALQARRLLDLRPYTRLQMNTLLEGSAKNQNIYGGHEARAIVRRLAKEHPADVNLLRKFQRQVKSWPY